LSTGVEDAMKSGNVGTSKDLIKVYETIKKAIVARKLAKTKATKDSKRSVACCACRTMAAPGAL